MFGEKRQCSIGKKHIIKILSSLYPVVNCTCPLVDCLVKMHKMTVCVLFLLMPGNYKVMKSLSIRNCTRVVILVCRLSL